MQGFTGSLHNTLFHCCSTDDTTAVSWQSYSAAFVCVMIIISDEQVANIITQHFHVLYANLNRSILGQDCPLQPVKEPTQRSRYDTSCLTIIPTIITGTTEKHTRPLSFF
jgi:hypothetical protein